jgi:hypothetical protein
MATTNRSVSIETGAISVRVGGPDSLRILTNCAHRIIEGLRDGSGRLPMGFQASGYLNTERSPEDPC